MTEAVSPQTVFFTIRCQEEYIRLMFAQPPVQLSTRLANGHMANDEVRQRVTVSDDEHLWSIGDDMYLVLQIAWKYDAEKAATMPSRRQWYAVRCFQLPSILPSLDEILTNVRLSEHSIIRYIERCVPHLVDDPTVEEHLYHVLTTGIVHRSHPNWGGNPKKIGRSQSLCIVATCPATAHSMATDICVPFHYSPPRKQHHEGYWTATTVLTAQTAQHSVDLETFYQHTPSERLPLYIDELSITSQQNKIDRFALIREMRIEGAIVSHSSHYPMIDHRIIVETPQRTYLLALKPQWQIQNKRPLSVVCMLNHDSDEGINTLLQLDQQSFIDQLVITPRVLSKWAADDGHQLALKEPMLKAALVERGTLKFGFNRGSAFTHKWYIELDDHRLVLRFDKHQCITETWVPQLSKSLRFQTTDGLLGQGKLHAFGWNHVHQLWCEQYTAFETIEDLLKNGVYEVVEEPHWHIPIRGAHAYLTTDAYSIPIYACPTKKPLYILGAPLWKHPDIFGVMGEYTPPWLLQQDNKRPSQKRQPPFNKHTVVMSSIALEQYAHYSQTLRAQALGTVTHVLGRSVDISDEVKPHTIKGVERVYRIDDIALLAQSLPHVQGCPWVIIGCRPLNTMIVQDVVEQTTPSQSSGWFRRLMATLTRRR